MLQATKSTFDLNLLSITPQTTKQHGPDKGKINGYLVNVLSLSNKVQCKIFPFVSNFVDKKSTEPEMLTIDNYLKEKIHLRVFNSVLLAGSFTRFFEKNEAPDNVNVWLLKHGYPIRTLKLSQCNDLNLSLSNTVHHEGQTYLKLEDICSALEKQALEGQMFYNIQAVINICSWISFANKSEWEYDDAIHLFNLLIQYGSTYFEVRKALTSICSGLYQNELCNRKDLLSMVEKLEKCGIDNLETKELRIRATGNRAIGNVDVAGDSDSDDNVDVAGDSDSDGNVDVAGDSDGDAESLPQVFKVC